MAQGFEEIWTNSNVSSNFAKEGLTNNITTFEPTCNSKTNYYLWSGPKMDVPKSLIAHLESLIITNAMQVSWLMTLKKKWKEMGEGCKEWMGCINTIFFVISNVETFVGEVYETQASIVFQCFKVGASDQPFKLHKVGHHR
jgi:hypothetical protein